jgi:hypothetical protein
MEIAVVVVGVKELVVVVRKGQRRGLSGGW